MKPRKPQPPTHGVIITTGKGVRTQHDLCYQSMQYRIYFQHLPSLGPHVGSSHPFLLL